MGTTRRTLYGKETLTGADHPNAPAGRGQARLRLHRARGGQGPRDKRGHLPPLEKPLWWDESSQEAKRLKELEKENARLKKLLAEKELDIDLLKEVNRGNF